MDRMKSLQNKSITQFTICLIGILLLAAPLFYVITEKYYAEELEDILACVRSQHPIGNGWNSYTIWAYSGNIGSVGYLYVAIYHTSVMETV